MIAIPRSQKPGGAGVRDLLSNPYLGMGAAAVLFIACAIAVVMMLGPKGAKPAAHLSLASALSHAPQGWRDALPAKSADPLVSEEVVRLSDHAAGPPIASAAPAGGPTPTQAVLTGGALAPAPIAGFWTPGPGGPLPIISQDGRTPFQVYRRPFTPNGRPKVALVIGGLGLNARATQQAIETLPGAVTLSFAPYAEGLQDWINMARAHGHEVLLETPMEPVDYPDNDPGPYTLMAAGQPGETVKKLEWVLSRATGYFGLTNYLGSRFLSSDTAYAAFANAARGRGLAFIDDGAAQPRGGGLPRASADRVIDDKLTPAAIDQQLMALEFSAQQHGAALGTGFAYPVTLEKVARWALAVEGRGYQLAPASALAAQK